MAFRTDFLTTEDDIKIAYDHYLNGFDKVIIVAHGFNFSKDIFAIKKAAEMFSTDYDVITFDLRGHGKSGDLFTFTALEERDLRCVVEYAKNKAYKKIACLGFSLGGSISIIEGSHNRDIDNIISVSTPYDIWKISMEIWDKKAQKELEVHMSVTGKGKGFRPGSPLIAKVRPVDVVQKISPRPILFIQGERDLLVKKDHAEKLFEKAGEPKEIHMLKDAGHAESIVILQGAEFETICKDWLKRTF